MINAYSNGCDRLTAWTALSTDGFAVARTVDACGTSSEPVGTNAAFGQLWVSNVTVGAASSPAASGARFGAAGLPLALGTQTIIAAVGDLAGNVSQTTNTLTVTIVTNGTYTYSAVGCVTGIVFTGYGYGRTNGLTWDGLYRLTGVTTNGGLAEAHGYDVLDRRVWTWTPDNGTNWHVWDGPHVVADLNSDGSLLRSYVHGPGVDNLLAMTVYGSTTNTYYFLTDPMGTVHAVTDGSGRIVESYRFDAWGRVLGVYGPNNVPLSQSAIGNHYLWMGREYSWASGLYYVRARYYDPLTGRFVSPDPSCIASGLSLYAAFGNAPTVLRDPWGLCEESALDGFRKSLGDVLDAVGEPLHNLRNNLFTYWWEFRDWTGFPINTSGIPTMIGPVQTRDRDYLLDVIGSLAGGRGGKGVPEGWKPIKGPPINSHGQPVFKKGSRYLTPDVDSHRGGAWKMFDSKGRRLGTYDEAGNRIGK